MSNGDAFQKRQSGELLSDVYKAPWHNAIVDAVNDHKRREQNTGRELIREFADGDAILVKNSSGADRLQYDILGLDAPLVLPADNLTEFKRQVAMDGVLPSCDHVGKFCILLKSIPDGEIGPALAGGIVPVQLEVEAESHAFAEIKAGDAEKLITAKKGSCRILWKPTGLGSSSAAEGVWGIVRFSNPKDLTCGSGSSSSSGGSSSSSSGGSSSGAPACIQSLGDVDLADVPQADSSSGGVDLDFVLGIDSSGCLVKVPVADCPTSTSSSGA